MVDLNTKIIELDKVGEVLSGRLKRLGIETVRDLLFYFPFRYEDYSVVAPIKDLKAGEQVSVKAKIELIATKRSPRKKKLITEAVVADGSVTLRVVWFGQPYISKILRVGDEVYLSGKISAEMLGPQMIGPNYEKVKNPVATADKGGNNGTTHTARIVPIYPLTAGITQKQMRYLTSQAIPLRTAISDWLTEDILVAAKLAPLQDALAEIHFPKSEANLALAEKRLKFDELFILQLRAEMIRQSLRRLSAPSFTIQIASMKDFSAKLPFVLTNDQKVAVWEILKDTESNEPMNRLLEGDVGSGKTVVAAMTMYNAALNGYQSALMAPTEILATQHLETLNLILGQFGVKIGLLTGSQSIMAGEKISKKNFLAEVSEGSAQIIIGTHALLSEKVKFHKLGMTVVDEQHRFGVAQRKIISAKSGAGRKMPHFLSMTATPIPRSFALTLYGDLDLSIIKQMPSGRKPIKTRAVAPHNREKAYQFIRAQVALGRQVFVVCPLIENIEKEPGRSAPELNPKFGGRGGLNDKKTVMEEYEKLKTKIFPDLRIGYLHGKMKPAEKEKTMSEFSAGGIDILVATAVVEVGVNIPNASVMMIEGSDRFGLAQLHQFRGRVGRSEHQSYCFLFTDSDSQKTAERLGYFEKNLDGFALAEYDLQTRGPGEVYGTTQSGLMNLRLATMRDVEIIKLARQLAKGIDFEKNPQFKDKVKEWEKTVHLE